MPTGWALTFTPLTMPTTCSCESCGNAADTTATAPSLESKPLAMFASTSSSDWICEPFSEASTACVASLVGAASPPVGDGTKDSCAIFSTVVMFSGK